MEDQSSESCESDGEEAELDPATLILTGLITRRIAMWCNESTFEQQDWKEVPALMGHQPPVLSGTLSSAATSSVVKGGSDSAPAASPDAGTSSGAVSVGGQSDLGQDHSVAIAPSSTYRSSRPMPSRRRREFPVAPPAFRSKFARPGADYLL
jgi:hypothetical protein